uniref:pyridoxine 5'-phosphate synthase n=1 Tax=Kordiimonas sp. TaxID=1970157 RepID=UPI003A945B65
RHKPHAACLVPEKRQELTTEGGLDVAGQQSRLKHYVDELSRAGIRVSLFVDPSKEQLDATVDLGAPVAEIHTGAYCELTGEAQQEELERIRKAVQYGYGRGLEMHAGHGLAYETVSPIAAMPELAELNIGHFLIGEAIFHGLEVSIAEMRRLMDEARA